jgi:hypothetical protein
VRLRIYLIAAFPFLFLMSGFMQDPFTAMLIAAIYEVGLAGLCLFYKSAFQPNAALSWMYLGLGILLVVLAWIWLEVLSKIIPYGLFH